jgi:hypothetical protein
MWLSGAQRRLQQHPTTTNCTSTRHTNSATSSCTKAASDYKAGKPNVKLTDSPLMIPREDVLAHNLRNASPDQVIPASRWWRVSAMDVPHRPGELGLHTEWGYHSALNVIFDRNTTVLYPQEQIVLHELGQLLLGHKGHTSTYGWSVPGFMDTGLSRDLTDVSIS